MSEQKKTEYVTDFWQMNHKNIHGIYFLLIKCIHQITLHSGKSLRFVLFMTQEIAYHVYERTIDKTENNNNIENNK